MAKTSPWHAPRNTGKKVYHDNDKCTEGNNVEARYRKPGTDKRPKCNQCSQLPYLPLIP